MEEKVIQLCKDVIKKNGDVYQCDCTNICCGYCPFSIFNENGTFTCNIRENEYNYDIAHEYISCMEKIKNI